MKERRVFLAVPLPREIADEITSRRSKLGLDLNWIPESNLHLTLIFFGNSSEERIAEIIHLLKQLKSQEAFELQAEGFAVQSTKYYQMIWTTFKKNLEFESLVYACSKKLKLELDRKPLPHVNMVRSKVKIKSDKLPHIFEHPLRWKVNCMELYESILSPAGAKYVLLEQFLFR